jgi:hypothetical protein
MKKHYPQGYLPKIAYWAGQLQRAAEAGDQENTFYIKSKLDYFVNRQAELETKEIPQFEGTSSTLRNLSIFK